MSDQLNHRFTFDSYVVGDPNRPAVTAAKTVAENLASTHNPLFLYGDTGLGKSHILTAVGHFVRQRAPDLKIQYLTLDDLMNAFDEAKSAGRVELFRERITVDVLLIDDVQFIGHRPEIQAELLRFMTQMQGRGAQLVLTSDRPPSDIENLDDSVLSLLGGGLVVDIATPDRETRMAIVNRRAEERGVVLDERVIEVAAGGDFGNVRELLGVLNRLIAFQAVSEHPLTPESARALVMGDTGPAAAPPSRGTGGSVPLIEMPPAREDEFGFFMSGVTATVNEQVERLGGKLRDSIDRWSAKGYRTTILEAALNLDQADGVDDIVSRYEESVAGLRTLQHQMAECDPERAGDPVFTDPARLQEATEMVRQAQGEFEPPPSPSEAFALGDFLESDDTKMAVSAARSVAEDPGTHYNPFVIVGGSGQGKTHLLHGIGRQIAASGGVVACVSAQAFVDQLVTAFAENRIPSWRARYRRAKAFLLDNIDLLGERERIQEELFYLFNVMEEAGRQLVFTSNVPPRQIGGLDDRLRSRLEGGLVVTLDPPDFALRRAVAVQQFTNRAGPPDDDLADFVAQQAADSVRSVLGIGHRVLTAAEARGEAPSLELATQVLAPEDERTGAAARGGGVIVLPSGGIESREKVVQEWPDPVAGIIEEFR